MNHSTHRRLIYLSHPQVAVDPKKDIHLWSLNDTGRQRVARLAASGVLSEFSLVISSAETKAVETAAPLAQAIGCTHEIHGDMHENDRSATGFLPPAEFERTADQFFAAPNDSVRGWETAIAAQTRILRALSRCLTRHPEGDILFVGHGAVGTLLYCHLAKQAINRSFDQGPGGGGCYFEFSNLDSTPKAGWQVIENLYGFS